MHADDPFDYSIETLLTIAGERGRADSRKKFAMMSQWFAVSPAEAAAVADSAKTTPLPVSLKRKPRALLRAYGAIYCHFCPILTGSCGLYFLPFFFFVFGAAFWPVRIFFCSSLFQ